MISCYIPLNHDTKFVSLFYESLQQNYSRCMLFELAFHSATVWYEADVLCTERRYWLPVCLYLLPRLWLATVDSVRSSTGMHPSFVRVLAFILYTYVSFVCWSLSLTCVYIHTNMHTHKFVHIVTCIFMNLCVLMYVQIRIFANLWSFVCIHVCRMPSACRKGVYTYIYMHMYMCMYVALCVCTSMQASICIYIYIYIYIYTHTRIYVYKHGLCISVIMSSKK